MPKRKLLNMLLVASLIVAQLLGLLIHVQPFFATAKDNVTIKRDDFVMEVQRQVNEDEADWQVAFDLQEAVAEDTRVKLQIQPLAEQQEIPDEITHMELADEWFVETEFLKSTHRSFSFTTSKEVEYLEMFVQIDQQFEEETIEVIDEVETPIVETILSENLLTEEDSGPFDIDFREGTEETEPTNESADGESEEATKEPEISEEVQGPPTPPAETETSDSSAEAVPQELPEKEKSAVPNKKDEGEDPKERPQETAPAEVIPKQRLLNEVLASGKLYDPFAPEYVPDTGEGVFPENFWEPFGNTLVRNHDGGEAYDKLWMPTYPNFAVEDDRSRAYILYDTGYETSIALRELAYESDNPEVFNVRMNLWAGKRYRPGADIVFLLDNGDSMTNSLKQSIKPAMENMMTTVREYAENRDDFRVGAKIFGDGTSPPGGPLDFTTHLLDPDYQMWPELVNFYTGEPPQGVASLKYALAEAERIFSEGKVIDKDHQNLSLDPALRSKSIFLLVNNQPNSTDDFAEINAIANNLKSKGIQIHTVLLNASAKTPSRFEKNVMKMSSKKYNASSTETAENYFYTAFEDSNLPADVLSTMIENMWATVHKGSIQAPLSEMVELEGDLTNTDWQIFTSDRAVKTFADDDAGKPEILFDSTTKTIKVNNINLAPGEELEVNFRVRLNKDHADFSNGTWYLIHEPTTVMPTPETSLDELEFGVPAVRLLEGEIATILVNKNWYDYAYGEENFWQLRPDQLVVHLEKEISPGDWAKIEEVILTSDVGWSGTFNQVLLEPGANYRLREVIDNADHLPGYKAPRYSVETFTTDTLPDTPIYIDNELLLTDFDFYKYQGEMMTPFDEAEITLPEFQLYKNGQAILTPQKPDSLGRVTFPNVAFGTYELVEVNVPPGYQKMPNKTIEVVENETVDYLVTQIDGADPPFEIINEVDDFTLEIEKTDLAGNPLTGAAFLLEGREYSEESTGDGPKYVFTGLRPGDYYLIETATPENFFALDDFIHFTINQDGSVTIDDHPLVTGAGGISPLGNKINLTVANQPMNILPPTGGSGRRLLMTVSLLCFVSAGLIDLFYWFRKGRRAK